MAGGYDAGRRWRDRRADRRRPSFSSVAVIEPKSSRAASQRVDSFLSFLIDKKSPPVTAPPAQVPLCTRTTSARAVACALLRGPFGILSIPEEAMHAMRSTPRLTVLVPAATL